jgi:hypothetical protein
METSSSNSSRRRMTEANIRGRRRGVISGSMPPVLDEESELYDPFLALLRMHGYVRVAVLG